MKITIIQSKNEGINEFEIKYNDTLKYIAHTPFVSIKEPLNLEKIRQIKLFDLNKEEVYSTNYNYLENLKEEFIPFKFLITKTQKFNQLVFLGKNTIKVYYEENGIWNNRYVINMDGKNYFCYSILDGYVRHFPIYDGEIQIAEALKSNVIIDAKDEYYCYLKEGYETLSDGIAAFLLYLDRSEYSSSYLVNKSITLTKSYSYNKTNKYYNKDWVKNNFTNEFFEKVEQDVKQAKEKLKHPISTSKSYWKSLDSKEKKLIKFIILTPWILIGIGIIISILILILV